MANEDTINEYHPGGSLKSQKPKEKTTTKDAAAVADKMAKTNLGSLGKALTSDAPKQEDGESPAAFAKRFREYREARAKK